MAVPQGEQQSTVDLTGAEWQGTLWPHFIGSGDAGEARRRVLDEVLQHGSRSRLTAVLLALGVRVVVDHLAAHDRLDDALDGVAGADDATIDRWAADLRRLPD